MHAHAHMRIWIVGIALSLTGLAVTPHAFAQASEVPPPPAAEQDTLVPPPPPAATSVPAPPENYAVPPAPPAASRYPAAPDLNPPANSVTVETEPGIAPQLRIPAPISTRLRVLSTDLNTLAARGSGGITDGIFSIVTGGVLVTLGVLFDSDAQLEFLAPQLYVFGGSSIGRGLISLIIVPNPYDMMLEFSHMPMTTVRQVKARLHYGEHALEELSDRSRLARLLDGAISVGAGATLAGLTLSANSSVNAMASSDDRKILLVMGLLGATTLAIGGLISLLTSSDEERRWAAYQGLKERLEQDRALASGRTRRPRSTALAAKWTPVITGQVAMGMLTVTF